MQRNPKVESSLRMLISAQKVNDFDKAQKKAPNPSTARKQPAKWDHRHPLKRTHELQKVKWGKTPQSLRFRAREAGTHAQDDAVRKSSVILHHTVVNDHEKKAVDY